MSDSRTTITPRQRVAFKHMAENGGTIGQSMKAAGYSDTIVKTPNKVTDTKGWQLLLKQHLNDDLLAKKHNELINKTVKVTTKTGETIDTGEIDVNAVRSGLDMAYKLKGRYPQNNSGVAIQVNVNSDRDKFG